MTNLATWAACAAIVIMAAGGWYMKQLNDAETRGAEIERANVAAKANQRIAERRIRDAQFDKMDARQHCIDAGLDWVFGDDGKSFCR